MRSIVAVVGPTASGKTGLGLDLAERFGGEIVNADSVQVYRLLDIGSAKPTAEEQGRVPHHLVDVVDPDEPFTAADFAEHGHAAVADIHGRGALPVVVGGTALYVRALLQGLCPAPPRDDDVRAALNRRAEAEGWPALHAELTALDPDAAGRIHPNDRVRIERALEVFRITGQPISEFQRRHGFAERRYRSLVIGLRLPRDVLDARIEGRARTMIRAG